MEDGDQSLERRVSALRDWVLNHPTLWASVLISAVIGIRLLAVAEFNVDTAFALLQAGGAVSASIGALLTALPSLLLLLGMFILPLEIDLVKGAVEARSGLEIARQVGILIFTLAVAMAFLNVLSLLVLALVAISAWFGAVVAWFGAARSGFDAREVPIPLVLILVVILLLSPEIWFAPERVTLKDGPQVVAHVIEDEGKWTTLLTSDDRKIRRVESTAIASREVCAEPTLFLNKTLTELVGEPGSPPCPDD